MKSKKQALRKAMIERLQALPKEMNLAWSEMIARRVCAMEMFQQADTVCVFLSLPGEVDTGPIIQACRAEGKKTAAPRIRDGRMEFVLFESDGDLQKGFFGIYEPTGDQMPQGHMLIIMPGVAFDDDCRRIGHGGGYYDRYLAEHPDLRTVAVAFELQVQDKVPDEPHDIRPQFVVTEKRIIQKKLY